MVYLRSLDDQIQIHIQPGDNLLVGRLPKCDVVLEDGSVSSQHARLQLTDNQLRVVDMGSTNGTRVNYASIHDPALLLDGDTVEIGNVTFTVDGRELESPPLESAAMPAIVNLDPLDASQELSDTMLSIPMPSDEELEAELSAGGHDESYEHASGHESTDVEDTFEPFSGDPTTAGFLMALVILLISGALLCLIAWTTPVSF